MSSAAAHLHDFEEVELRPQAADRPRSAMLQEQQWVVGVRDRDDFFSEHTGEIVEADNAAF
jgi:hypothetical protein